MVLEELFHVVQKLKSFNILQVSSQKVFEVADVVVASTKMGIKVEWINRVLDEIGAKKDHYALLQEA